MPGLPAIEDCTAHGTSINITLIFSLERYKAVVEAYLRGLERLVAGGGDPSKVASVASFFVSRVDTEADKRLDAARQPGAAGQARDREREARLPALPRGVLRAALGVPRGQGRDEAALPLGLDLDEEPGLPRRDVRRGADRARHREHDAARDDRGVPGSRRGARRHRARGRRRGASSCSSELARRRRRLRRRRRDARGGGRAEVRRLVRRSSSRASGRSAASWRPRDDERSDLVERIWARDPTVWTGADEAQLARLARRAVADARGRRPRCCSSPTSVVDRIDAVVLLGMGGSSLAPEVLQAHVRRRDASTSSTRRIRRRSARSSAQLDLERTLFVSASKSGSTLETRSHTDYFWERAPRRRPVGRDHRPGLGARGARARARVRGDLPRRADDRRPLLGAVARSGWCRRR